jgi:hypothetical protein
MWPIHYNFVDDYTHRTPTGQPLDRRVRTFDYVRPKNRWATRSIRSTGNGLIKLANRLDTRRPSTKVH